MAESSGGDFFTQVIKIGILYTLLSLLVSVCVTSEWSAIEKEMGDGLQSAGHHMDTWVWVKHDTALMKWLNDLVCVCRYAASIDDILEEEEHYADQLKEYLFYTEAVR